MVMISTPCLRAKGSEMEAEIKKLGCLKECQAL